MLYTAQLAWDKPRIVVNGLGHANHCAFVVDLLSVACLRHYHYCYRCVAAMVKTTELVMGNLPRRHGTLESLHCSLVRAITTCLKACTGIL